MDYLRFVLFIIIYLLLLVQEIFLGVTANDVKGDFMLLLINGVVSALLTAFYMWWLF